MSLLLLLLLSRAPQSSHFLIFFFSPLVFLFFFLIFFAWSFSLSFFITLYPVCITKFIATTYQAPSSVFAFQVLTFNHCSSVFSCWFLGFLFLFLFWPGQCFRVCSYSHSLIFPLLFWLRAWLLLYFLLDLIPRRSKIRFVLVVFVRCCSKNLFFQLFLCDSAKKDRFFYVVFVRRCSK